MEKQETGRKGEAIEQLKGREKGMERGEPKPNLSNGPRTASASRTAFDVSIADIPRNVSSD